MSTPPRVQKPRQKVLKEMPSDYQSRKGTVVTERSLAAEFEELRTRTPGNRG